MDWRWLNGPHEGKQTILYILTSYCSVEQVYLPAVAGHIPPKMVQTLSAFLDFCYLVHHASINEDMLNAIDDLLTCFHANWTIFEEVDMWPAGFSLPWQHTLKHYKWMIQLLGMPNGLCSLITESKHIKAVKEPWHCSNWYEALSQMLLLNQHTDKLNSTWAYFIVHNMVDGPHHTVNRQPLPALLDYMHSSNLKCTETVS